MGKLKHALKENEILILDGALGTELEYRGHDVSGSLWSAKYLLENPEVIQKIHEEYILAGSDLLISSSYQASLPGLEEAGLTEAEARSILISTICIAKKAVENAWDKLADEDKKRRIYPLVGGSIGPYAAYLADGSEYTGIYQVVDRDLIDFHEFRIQTLLEAGADFLAIETIPNLSEVNVLIKLLQQYPKIDAYISFTSQDGRTISDGTPIEEVITLCETVENLVAVGVNCTAPNYISPLLERIRSSSDKPCIVYPNSGEIYDDINKIWHHNPNNLQTLAEYSQIWKYYGAKIFGGCCRTRPADILQLRRSLLG